jgi:TRAP-type C4-dicarboxylate transport system permease small subunit
MAWIYRLLDALAKLCAVAAGLLLTGITLMTCASLFGRNTTGWTIVGDFELTAYAAGAAIALFLPICQLRRANIIVDFFTARAGERTREALDRIGAAMLAAAMGLMTWRSWIGAVNAWESRTGSMMLGVPDWWVYVGIVPALALTTLIAAVQALAGFMPGEPAAPGDALPPGAGARP